MLFSALGSIGERLDSKFITAYFFPAFVAVLGTIWILITAAGGLTFAERVAQWDSAKQAIAVFIILLTTTMIAYMLQALAKPIGQLFAGRMMPRPVKTPLIRGQLRARARARLGLGGIERADRLFPRDPDETHPTAFGNTLAAAADYPRLVYAMEGFHWWPRLQPLLPAEFQEQLAAQETPMRAMLNLSLVSLYLGCLGAAALGLASSQLPIAAAWLVAGCLFASFFYRTAITQAAEFARTIWVAFDLYRYSILEQLHEQEPANLDEERALWQRLGARLHPFEEAMPTGATDAVASPGRTPEVAQS
jgi:hypothetical protein